MKIQFVVDYRGVLTGERFFEAGSVVELATGQALIDAGRAVAYQEPEPEPVKPKRTRTRKAK